MAAAPCSSLKDNREIVNSTAFYVQIEDLCLYHFLRLNAVRGSGFSLMKDPIRSSCKLVLTHDKKK